MTLLAPHLAPKSEHVPEHFLFHGVDWNFYQQILKAVEDRRVFVTYDRGELEIMSPSRPHERYKKILARLIEVITEELDLPMSSDGSTTFQREDLDRGLEPDECYYVQNEAAVREIKDADLTKEPPPDLVVEMDYSYRMLDREGIYAAMGVPEVWRFNLVQLEFLRLTAGQYQHVETSTALPGLPRAEVERFVKMRATTGETQVIKAWRLWVQSWSHAK